MYGTPFIATLCLGPDIATQAGVSKRKWHHAKHYVFQETLQADP